MTTNEISYFCAAFTLKHSLSAYDKTVEEIGLEATKKLQKDLEFQVHCSVEANS